MSNTFSRDFEGERAFTPGLAYIKGLSLQTAVHKHEQHYSGYSSSWFKWSSEHVVHPASLSFYSCQTALLRNKGTPAAELTCQGSLQFECSLANIFPHE